MNIARLMYPVRVLGPGDRIGLWLAGCHRGCKGCSNPELWNQRPEYEIAVADVMKLIRKVKENHPVDGFTISGGEPMDQAHALAELVTELLYISSDILIYTGYRLEELQARDDLATAFVLEHSAVLIDGAYMEERNDNSVLRGSSNQRIHILDNSYSSLYQSYIVQNENHIQNFTTSDGIVSVGIHHPGFRQPI